MKCRATKFSKMEILVGIIGITGNPIAKNHKSQQRTKATLKITEKTQKWGRSVPEPEMGRRNPKFWPEVENDGGERMD